MLTLLAAVALSVGSMTAACAVEFDVGPGGGWGRAIIVTTTTATMEEAATEGNVASLFAAT